MKRNRIKYLQKKYPVLINNKKSIKMSEEITSIDQENNSPEVSTTEIIEDSSTATHSTNNPEETPGVTIVEESQVNNPPVPIDPEERMNDVKDVLGKLRAIHGNVEEHVPTDEQEPEVVEQEEVVHEAKPMTTFKFNPMAVMMLLLGLCFVFWAVIQMTKGGRK